MNNDKSAVTVSLETTIDQLDHADGRAALEEIASIVDTLPAGIRGLVGDMVLASYRAGLVEGMRP